MEASAVIALIIQGVQAAIQFAPQAEEIAEKGKALITSLFESGAISVATQNAAHAHIDAIQAAVQAGTVPPAWQVQPDPTPVQSTLLPPA